MRAAILSAGKNRRLTTIRKPKGLIELEGQTLLERTLFNLDRLGYKELFCVIRRDAVKLEHFLKRLGLGSKLTIVKRNSRNPLYSQMALSRHVKDGGILTFNVDAFYQMKDLEQFTEKMRDARYLRGKDMIMWGYRYNPEIDDPAFMKLSSDYQVVDYGKDLSPTKYVFGQVRYCSARILHLNSELFRQRIYRMKKYIKYLIRRKYHIYAYITDHDVYDIDTPQDLMQVKELVGHV